MSRLERELARHLEGLAQAALRHYPLARRESGQMIFWKEGPELSFGTFLQARIGLGEGRLTLDVGCSLLETGKLPRLACWSPTREFPYRSKQQCRRALNQLVEALEGTPDEARQRLEELRADEELVEGLTYLHTNWTALSQNLEHGDSLVPYLSGRFTEELASSLDGLARALLARRDRPRNLEVEAFLADLREAGSTDSSGGFTLDTSLARKKLGAFQLLEPEEFVVHAVAAATAGGASTIALYVDSDEVKLDFDGQPITRLEMEGIFPSLLTRQVGRSQELAVALNAAGALQPMTLVLESHHQGQGWRLEVRPDSESIEPLPSAPPAPHRLYFRARPSWRVVRRFWAGAPRREEQLVKARCRRTPARLDVMGEAVNEPLDCRGALLTRHLQSNQASLAFLAPQAGPLEVEPSPGAWSAVLALGLAAGLEICRFGVLYALPELEWRPRSAVLVEAPGLPTDLSRSHLLLSPELRSIMRRLKAEEEQMLAVLPEAVARQPWHPGLLEALNHDLPELHHLPLLPLVGGEYASLDSWKAREVLITEGDWSHPPLRGQRVIQVRPTSRDSLARLFPHARGGEALLRQAQHYHESRERWLALPPQPPQVRGCRFKQVLADGEVGLPDRAGLPLPPAQVELGSQGRPLFKRTWSQMPAGLVACLHHPQLEADDDWADLRPTPVLAQLESRLVAALAGLYQPLLEELEDPLARAYLHSYLLYLLFHERLGQWAKVAAFARRDGSRASLEELQGADLREVPEAEPFRAWLA